MILRSTLRGGRRNMGSWEDWTLGLGAILSGGISLVAEPISQATGWDTDVYNSQTWTNVINPALNIAGDVMGWGPAGDYIGGTSNAINKKVPLPSNWLPGGKSLPPDVLDRMAAGPKGTTRPAPAARPALPKTAAPAAFSAVARQGYGTGVYPSYGRYGKGAK